MGELLESLFPNDPRNVRLNQLQQEPHRLIPPTLRDVVEDSSALVAVPVKTWFGDSFEDTRIIDLSVLIAEEGIMELEHFYHRDEISPLGALSRQHAKAVEKAGLSPVSRPLIWFMAEEWPNTDYSSEGKNRGVIVQTYVDASGLKGENVFGPFFEQFGHHLGELGYEFWGARHVNADELARHRSIGGFTLDRTRDFPYLPSIGPRDKSTIHFVHPVAQMVYLR